MIKIKDIVDTALNSEDFTTLCKVVTSVGLLNPLRGKGSFTFFAPTNEAFAWHSAAELDALLKDKKKLTSVLTYHPGSWKMMVADFKRPKTVKTVQGQEIKVDGMTWYLRKYIKVNDVKTLKTDIEATTDVIYVIDTVLMPKYETPLTFLPFRVLNDNSRRF